MNCSGWYLVKRAKTRIQILEIAVRRMTAAWTDETLLQSRTKLAFTGVETKCGWGDMFLQNGRNLEGSKNGGANLNTTEEPYGQSGRKFVAMNSALGSKAQILGQIF